jgi:hypothetical protein
LENNLKIGVIVNDVAAINIDAKMASAQTIQHGELKMEAPAALSDELFTSVEAMEGRDLIPSKSIRCQRSGCHQVQLDDGTAWYSTESDIALHCDSCELEHSNGLFDPDSTESV